MKDLLSFIIKSIVASPKKIQIDQEGNQFIIKAPKEEIGTIIGRQGKIIKAIKTILIRKSKGSRFSIEVQEL